MKTESIKFKAKRLDNGEWIEGSLTYFQGKAYIHRKESDEDDRCYLTPYKVIPETVCQFTGLKDCKGNEIWEGDIIKDPYLCIERTIEWNNHLCSFTALDETNSSDKPLGALVGSLGWYVIGNKFDKEK